MSDADLEAIRKARLQELKQQRGGGGGGGGAEDDGEDGQQKRQEQEARQHILSQILTADAQDRLGRIKLVKESRAVEVENRLITMARTNQIRQKVTEDQLKEMLSAVSEQRQEQEKIVVRRTKGGWDDDDDDLLDL